MRSAEQTESNNAGPASQDGKRSVRGLRSRFVQRANICCSAAVLLIHTILLAVGGWVHSPAWDEVGHLPAGISHWELGNFDLYRVNPPLVRMVAAVPVAVAGPAVDWYARQWPGIDAGSLYRGEWGLGRKFIKTHGERAFWYFTWARWACIPFSLLGAVICYRWARELYGATAGFVALTLWCFSPNILANGQMITPDVGAASLGAAACYAFWHWLQRPGWQRAFGVGLVLGLTELTKFTWVVLFALWPLVWVVWRWRCPARHLEQGGQASCDGDFSNDSGRASRRRSLGSTSCYGWRSQLGQLTLLFLLAVYVIHLGYGFELPLRRLGDFVFVSRTLSGGGALSVPTVPGNRFADSPLAAVPVPLPANYVLGIDRQKRDFEHGFWSYLRGEWRHGGWWYYYLYGLAVKVPLGTWLIALAAVSTAILHRESNADWRDQFLLLAPAVVILVLVSSQTGFNHHLRYVLPALPFVFIWISQAVRMAKPVTWGLMLALCWSVSSSLYVYPHSHAYFNKLAGGPRHGHEHLLDSNIDWGQDLSVLKHWLDQHPEARPLYLAYSIPSYILDPADIGIVALEPLHGVGLMDGVPPPGWYAIFVRELRERDGRYKYFLDLEPVEVLGYSVYIYHITLEGANHIRRKHGQPELSADWVDRQGMKQKGRE